MGTWVNAYGMYQAMLEYPDLTPIRDFSILLKTSGSLPFHAGPFIPYK